MPASLFSLKKRQYFSHIFAFYFRFKNTNYYYSCSYNVPNHNVQCKRYSAGFKVDYLKFYITDIYFELHVSSLLISLTTIEISFNAPYKITIIKPESTL